MDAQQVRLIEEKRRMATGIAVKVWHSAREAIDRDELVAVALLALVQSVIRWPEYCEENGHDRYREDYFGTYLHMRVNGAVYDHLRSLDYMPRNDRKKFKALVDAGYKEGASVAELVARTGMSEEEVNKTLSRSVRRSHSMDESVPNELMNSQFKSSNTPWSEFCLDSHSDSHAIVNAKLILDAFREAFEKLSIFQQTVLAYHYYGGLSFQEIAEVFGVTDTMTSQSHVKAILALHKAMESSITDIASAKVHPSGG